MNDYKFGNFIYSLRIKKGLTQADIAQMLEVSSAAVSKWENGSAKPKYETLSKLARVLDVSVEELVAGERAQTHVDAEVIEPPKNKSLLTFIAVSVSLCVVLFCIVFAFAMMPKTEKSGLNSNNQSYAMIVEHDGWIYYCDPFSVTPYLYKMRTDKSEKQRLLTDTVTAISVTDDWVYYAKQTISDDYAGVYRMNHDGKQKELLASGNFWYVYATDEWVYYADGVHTSGGQLYRMKPDGTRTEQLSSELCMRFSVSGDWVYYLGEIAGRVFKLNLSTGEKIQLESKHYLTQAVVEDGVLYTYDGHTLISQNLNTTEKKEYLQKDISRFNVCDGYIYVAKETSKKTTFYKMDLNFENQTEIYKMDSFFNDIYMCVIDDWLYFCNNEKSHLMYRVKTDGSGEIELVN